MIFKKIETDQEWSAAIELRNRRNWSHPVSVAEERSFHERTRQNRKDFRFIGIEADEIVGYGYLLETINSTIKNSFWMDFSVDPAHPEAAVRMAAMADEGWRMLQEQGGVVGRVEARGEHPYEVEVFRSMGYEFEKRLPYSQLLTNEVDYQKQEGVISFAEFLAMFPEDGLHKFWRLEMEVAADLPLPFPFVETPFESFVPMITNPENDLTSKFVLYEDGQLKGLTQLWASQVDSKLAATGLTGVRREFRRQRVATRLKQHAAAWAKERGIERIFTDNEENNPMYQLNLQLGFRHLFDYEVYSKPC